MTLNARKSDSHQHRLCRATQRATGVFLEKRMGDPHVIEGIETTVGVSYPTIEKEVVKREEVFKDKIVSDVAEQSFFVITE